MKYFINSQSIKLLFSGLFLLSTLVSAQAEQSIKVKEAYKYVGETKIVC
jgi:hypothetical protein